MSQTNHSTYAFAPLKGYEHFEATTQIIISEILRRGLPLEIIDPENNLIAVHYKNREFIILEGTISDANSLIAYWISNNKWMTKQFLARKGISHSKGIILSENFNPQELQNLNFPLVVKPVDTDHGIAVSTNLSTKDELTTAIKKAFEHASKIIIEEHYTGREYRFLVIDYEVRAIAFREPANVSGNGKLTIRQLIEEKNKNRGDDYTHPLLKIKPDSEVVRHLKAQNLTLDSVPAENEKIFLRKNSNLSTGGDSIDVTDEIPDSYKNIAKEAAKSAGLRIAGIDMIIKSPDEEPTPENHIVIELNAPAMLSMHNYPYIGKNRHVEKYVLDCILNSGL